MKKPQRKQLLTHHDAVQEKKQHVSPCSDCPWARKSLAGWLGATKLGRWLLIAHSDGRMECHTRLIGKKAAQCAGGAIYRRNVCKRVNPPLLTLPADTTKVFASPLEFATHHSEGAIKTNADVAEIFRCETMAAITEKRDGNCPDCKGQDPKCFRCDGDGWVCDTCGEATNEPGKNICEECDREQSTLQGDEEGA